MKFQTPCYLPNIRIQSENIRLKGNIITESETESERDLGIQMSNDATLREHIAKMTTLRRRVAG